MTVNKKIFPVGVKSSDSDNLLLRSSYVESKSGSVCGHSAPHTAQVRFSLQH